jgi:hypothetical protein
MGRIGRMGRMGLEKRPDGRMACARSALECGTQFRFGCGGGLLPTLKNFASQTAVIYSRPALETQAGILQWPGLTSFRGLGIAAQACHSDRP